MWLAVQITASLVVLWVVCIPIVALIGWLESNGKA